MRLRNSGKSAAAQKTPPARKTSARAAQKTPESNTEVETPKIAETRRGSAAKGKQVKVAASDDKLEQTLGAFITFAMSVHVIFLVLGKLCCFVPVVNFDACPER